MIKVYLSKVLDSAYLLKDFCKNIGLKEVGYSRAALTMDEISYYTGKEIIVSKKKFYENESNCINEIYENLITQCCLSDRSKLFLINNGDYFNKVLEQFYRGDDIEISPEYRGIYNMFLNPYFLPTKLALNYYTNQIIKSPDEWDALFVVSETGDWLNNPNNKRIVSLLIWARGGRFIILRILLSFFFTNLLSKIGNSYNVQQLLS